MKLSATGVKNLKPSESPTKHSDGGGLFILVTPQGSKLWRLAYRFDGKQKTLAIGAWPAVSLADAREARDEAKRSLAKGIDPGAQKKAEKVSASIKDKDLTFATSAQAYIDFKSKHLAPASIDKMRWLLAELSPSIGSKNATKMTSEDVLPILRTFEGAGKLDKCQRARIFIRQVVTYTCTGNHVPIIDPTAGLTIVLQPPKEEHHAAIFDQKEFGIMLQQFDNYRGDPSVRFALMFAPMCVLRSNEIRSLEWSFIDFDNALIECPESVMKESRKHYVPLSRQAIDHLKIVRAWSGGVRHVFPGRDKSRALSENTLNGAIRRLGYETFELTHHGIRRSFSTFMNEANFNADHIEMQLAHFEKNRVRGAYNAALYLDQRRHMMQAWCDMCDAMKPKPS